MYRYSHVLSSHLVWGLFLYRFQNWLFNITAVSWHTFTTCFLENVSKTDWNLLHIHLLETDNFFVWVGCRDQQALREMSWLNHNTSCDSARWQTRDSWCRIHKAPKGKWITTQPENITNCSYYNRLQIQCGICLHNWFFKQSNPPPQTLRGI